MAIPYLIIYCFLYTYYVVRGSASESDTQCSIQAAQYWDVQSEVKFFDEEKQEGMERISILAELKFPDPLNKFVFPNSHPHYGNSPLRHEKADTIIFEIGVSNTFYVTTRIFGSMRVCLFGMSGWMINDYRKNVYFLKDVPKNVTDKSVRELFEACVLPVIEKETSQNSTWDQNFHGMKPMYIQACTERSTMEYIIDGSVRNCPGNKLLLQNSVKLGDSLEMWQFSTILFWQTGCVTNGTTCISKDNGTWLNTDMKTNLAVVVALDVDEIRRSSACTDKFRHYDSFTSLYAPRKHEYINCSLMPNRTESKGTGNGKKQFYLKPCFVITLLAFLFLNNYFKR